MISKSKITLYKVESINIRLLIHNILYVGGSASKTEKMK